MKQSCPNSAFYFEVSSEKGFLSFHFRPSLLHHSCLTVPHDASSFFTTGCCWRTRRRGPAGAGAGLRGGHPGQTELGRQSGSQTGCTPAYRELKPLPGPQSGHQGTGWAPSYGAALVPKANGGSFSPICKAGQDTKGAGHAFLTCPQTWRPGQPFAQCAFLFAPLLLFFTTLASQLMPSLLSLPLAGANVKSLVNSFETEDWWIKKH